MRSAEGGDGDQVLDLCADLDEVARAELAGAAEQLATRLAISDQERRDWPVPEFRLSQSSAASTALLCVAPPSAYLLGVREVGHQRAERAILQRARSWRQRWLIEYLNTWGAIEWQLVRALLRAGACSTPGEAYSRAMARWVGYSEPGHEYHRDVYAELLGDPDLLDDDVFRIFEVDGLVSTWEGGFDLWSDWSAALLRLVAEERISRPRLLDACLAGTQRRFSAATVQAFSVFHGKLRPTADELAERHDIYLILLESPAKPAVGLGLRTLETLQRKGRLDGRALIDHLPAAPATLPRATARRVVDLVGRVLDVNPALAPGTVSSLLAALTHEASEVQQAVIAVLERHQEAIEPSSRARLTSIVERLDPSVRRRAAGLCGMPREYMCRAANALPIVPGPIRLDVNRIPRLREDERVAPVRTIEELLDLTAVVLERQDDPEELERWCDGVSRLCDQPVPGDRARPLIRRARSIIVPFPGTQRTTDTARAVVSIVAHHWLAGERMWIRAQNPSSFLPFPTDAGPRAALSRRLAALAVRSEGRQAGPMLSAPTHRGGWIDPLTLIDRLRHAGPIYDVDLAQALLRLAPDRSADALAAMAGIPGETAHVVRAALGQDIGPAAGESRLLASWDAVSVLRSPSSIGVDDPLPAWSANVTAGPCSPVTLMSRRAPAQTYAGDFNMRRWLQLVWPGNREPYYANALIRHGLTDNRWMTNLELDTIGVELEPLLDPDEPFGPNAIMLLAAALGAQTADRLLAAEVVIQGIATRRLDCDRLGRAIARRMSEPNAVPNRWGDSLRDVPAIGALHAHETQRMLEATLAELDQAQPKFPKVIDLLRQIAQEYDARINDENARAWLQRTPPRSKVGTDAHHALAVTGDGAQRAHAALAVAHNAERLRRLRWQTGTATPRSP